MLVAKRKKKVLSPTDDSKFHWLSFPDPPKKQRKLKRGKEWCTTSRKEECTKFCTEMLFFPCFHVPVKVVAAMNQRHPRFNITKLYNCVPQIPMAIYFWWQRLLGKHLEVEETEDSLQMKGHSRSHSFYFEMSRFDCRSRIGNFWLVLPFYFVILDHLDTGKSRRKRSLKVSTTFW